MTDTGMSRADTAARAMILPLTDIWGRKRCFVLGLTVYAVGGLLAAVSQGLPLLVVVWIILLARKITDAARPGPRPRFDLTGAVLSAAGLFFVVLEVNGYNAIQTGLLLTPATIGILAASAGADRFARRHPQRWLIIAGFLATAVGMILLLALVRAHSAIWTWVPGLLLFGAGVGVMLTSSVNVVQSSFPDDDQGEISGLSRSVSNLGSSLGTALIGLVLAILIPRQLIQSGEPADSAVAPETRSSAP